ncbi:MAG: putative zinc-binding metallopeptidase [Nitrospiraceae bacterium]
MDREESTGGTPDASSLAEPQWTNWPDEELLALRLCDLHVTVEGSQVAESIRQLSDELAARAIRFRPHFWLSDEWFSPDGVPGIAIPFYLAHPRLARLELAQMLEVEGGTPDWCMRILRHEAGHALENAYRLRRRRDRQVVFGRSTQPYPKFYAPKPYSKSYVLHLDMWYAQSHPDEDFAETFAVWLNPQSQWRERYTDWPALKKLEYMDGLMASLADARPSVMTKQRVDSLPRLRRTLREHYEKKHQHYGTPHPTFYDRDLRRIFSDASECQANISAVQFLSRIRREVRREVAAWTGEYQYTIDRVFEDIVSRCREQNLRVAVAEDKAKLDVTILLTVQTMNYLHSGHHRVAL